ncbi:mitochondrial metalloendopeptidase OMA1-like [Phoenix dactylifera]|uniref:Mitochondrial metalloendopeptidase OMA1-like n=1 Tax=Phoenix dactylifera TaxID=42345 RepID=A0A8B7CRI9_PHODC|nr:mitochondrial metalloendopeptidase OMA1-like [Phoenix dactylifera]
MAWFSYLRKLTNSFPSFSLPRTLRYRDSSSGQLHDDKVDWGIILEGLSQWLIKAQIQTVPYSNRIHLIIPPLEYETRHGELLFREEVSKYMTMNDILPLTHPTVVKVQSIAKKIFGVLDSELGINGATSTAKEREVSLPSLHQSTEHLEGMEWEVVVAREERINAFYHPGGKILVLTDLSGEFGTDADIAAAIAHEVLSGFRSILCWPCCGKACCGRLQRSPVCRSAEVADVLVKLPLIDRLLAILAEVLANVPLIGTPRLLYPLELPIGELILKWFSRRREKEADDIGMLLCASAGYDPFDVLKVFQNDRDSQDYFSTHPSGETRAMSLSRPKIMKQALDRYELPKNCQTLP